MNDFKEFEAFFLASKH
jgi:hypothetical protein